jgi:M6 family metalloprotease-like protein
MKGHRRHVVLPSTWVVNAVMMMMALSSMSSKMSTSSSHRNECDGEMGSLRRSISGFVTLARAIRANPNPIRDYYSYEDYDVHDYHKDEDDGISKTTTTTTTTTIGDGGDPIYIRGDEWLHWYEDEDGYTLIDIIDDDNDDNEHEEMGEKRNITTTESETTLGATRIGNRTKICGTPGRRCSSSYPSRRRRRRWEYAARDTNTGDLIGTGVRFGSPGYRDKIHRMGLMKHVRPSNNNTTMIRTSTFGNDGVRGRPSDRRNGRRLADSMPESLRNLVVLMRFSDHANRALPRPSDYDVLMNGPGGKGTVAPTGSVRDVLSSNSYGTFDLESTVYPWITLSQDESYYAGGVSGLSPKIFEGMREALDAIQSDPDFHLSHFNSDRLDGDGYIDAITFIHSGYGAEFGGTDCHGASVNDRIWSHKHFMYDGYWTSDDGTVTVADYNINPGLWGGCGSEISRIGVIAHETAHFLGLPDLYDPQGGEGAGTYCLMADSWGIDGSQRYPPMMSPWSRIELGWLFPTTLQVRGDFTLRRSWEYPDAYKIGLGSSSEYLLIENRQPGGYDVLLPLGGLAIWHVDDSMFKYANSLEGYPGQYGWPENGNHYQVSLLQADGKYDLERGRNRGDYSDLFRFDHYFGVDQLSPSTSDPKLGPFPNTDSYRLGGLGRTNHFIAGISGKGGSHVLRMHPLFARAKIIPECCRLLFVSKRVASQSRG